jgi:hypothetical protein
LSAADVVPADGNDARAVTWKAFRFENETVPVGPGTVLYQLYRLAGALSRDTGCSIEDVAMLVLTGMPPELRRGVATLTDREYGGLHLADITIKVHPTATPKEVRDVFVDLRRTWLSKQNATRPRQWTKRPPGLLVEFVRPQLGGQTDWPALLAQWNARWKDSHPSYLFKTVNSMQGEYKRAIKAATGEMPSLRAQRQ